MLRFHTKYLQTDKYPFPPQQTPLNASLTRDVSWCSCYEFIAFARGGFRALLEGVTGPRKIQEIFYGDH